MRGDIATKYSMIWITTTMYSTSLPSLAHKAGKVGTLVGDRRKLCQSRILVGPSLSFAVAPFPLHFTFWMSATIKGQGLICFTIVLSSL